MIKFFRLTTPQTEPIGQMSGPGAAEFWDWPLALNAAMKAGGQILDSYEVSTDKGKYRELVVYVPDAEEKPTAVEPHPTHTKPDSIGQRRKTELQAFADQFASLRDSDILAIFTAHIPTTRARDLAFRIAEAFRD